MPKIRSRVLDGCIKLLISKKVAFVGLVRGKETDAFSNIHQAKLLHALYHLEPAQATRPSSHDCRHCISNHMIHTDMAMDVLYGVDTVILTL